LMRAALRLSTRRRPSCRRFRGRRALCSAGGASRCRSTGALPRPKSARTPHVTNSCPRLPEKQAQSGWDKVPMNSPADSTGPSALGLHRPTFREEGQDCAPEVPSIDGQPRGAGSATPQIVTNLWSSRVRRLFYRRENLKALTCLGNRSTRRPGHSPKRSR